MIKLLDKDVLIKNLYPDVPYSFYETIIDQTSKARDALLHIKETIDPYAVLAGGALRNWQRDTPANDLDIFVRGTKDIVEVISLSDGEVIFDDNYGDDEGIECILNIYPQGGQKVQIIALKDEGTSSQEDWHKKVLSHIQGGLNRILWTGTMNTDGSLYTYCTQEEIDDLENKTITIFLNKLGIDEYKDRTLFGSFLPKLIQYYPDNKVILK